MTQCFPPSLLVSLVTMVPNTNPIQKTTITRFVHILAAVDGSYWEHNSDELAKVDPISIVTGFEFLPPTATQRASDHTIPKGDSTLEFSCDSGLGSLHPMAPIEVAADRWSTTPSLVFDPPVMSAWNEAGEVKVPQPEASNS